MHLLEHLAKVERPSAAVCFAVVATSGNEIRTDQVVQVFHSMQLI